MRKKKKNDIKIPDSYEEDLNKYCRERLMYEGFRSSINVNDKRFDSINQQIHPHTTMIKDLLAIAKQYNMLHYAMVCSLASGLKLKYRVNPEDEYQTWLKISKL